MDKCREEFEEWFKTTESYDFLKQMNYFNIDLFTFNKDRNQYQHSAVQIAYMTWQEKQKQIDGLEKRMNIARGLINTNNEFSPIKFIKADLNKVLMFKQALEGGEV
ncbi:hypothetical protein [uncultured Acinetobacter sp.]|uniref:hypothetical protein n=1 Tax=uncultured Acinetobacter sp. TaxID=165433 RepID=UPI00258BB0C9|nr:hypothetical protein [uncultured Acinetobacter sp.]